MAGTILLSVALAGQLAAQVQSLIISVSGSLVVLPLWYLSVQLLLNLLDQSVKKFMESSHLW